MPIYTYTCHTCKNTNDYLVGKAGEIPGECIGCGDNSLERVFAGRAFGIITGRGHITSNGKIRESSEVPVPDATQEDAKLEQGIYLTSGITQDGGCALNVSRVQKDGKVDGSVTGYKSLDSSHLN